MLLVKRLAGALLGAVPGLIVWAVGLIVTGGGDGMIGFGLGGVVLTLIGLSIGSIWGARSDGWLSDHTVLALVVGVAMVGLLIGGLVELGGGPPDPILNARDCLEVYELLGATGPLGELLELPDLSEEEINSAYATVEQNPSDPNCVQLSEDLGTQASP